MLITKCDKCKKKFDLKDRNGGSIYVYLKLDRCVPRCSWLYDFCPECMGNMQRAIIKELNNGQ